MSIQPRRFALALVTPLPALLAALTLATPAVAQLSSTEQAKVLGALPKPVSGYGVSAAISGDTAVVGDYVADSALGFGPSVGAAHVYVRDGLGWTEQARLEADPGTLSSLFGHSVAISGDTIVVGAGYADAGTGPNAGTAFVFVRSGTTWTQQAQLLPGDPAPHDNFGYAVAISGDTIVLGAPGHKAIASVMGDGAVYVFVRSGTTWTEQALLKASHGQFADSLGYSVAVEGDTLVAGAPLNNHAFQSNSGAAYVFVRDGVTWSQQTKLFDSDGGVDDQLGSSVALSGNTVVAGAPLDTIGSAPLQGTASVFVRSGTSWSQQAKLISSDGLAFDRFGWGLAVRGDLVLIGASGDANVNGPYAGSAYVFARAGGLWSEKLKFLASDGAENDFFGIAVGIGGDTLLVTAQLDDNEGGVNTGSTYFVRLDGDWTDLGFGLAGVAGVPALVGTGPLVGGTPGQLALSNARPSAPCIEFLSLAGNPAPFKGGTLVPLPPALMLGLVTPASGAITQPFTWPSGLPSGLSLHVQFAIADPAAINGVALSNALRGQTP